MKTVVLTQGRFALVDDEDFDAISKNKWCYAGNGYAHRKYGPKKAQIVVLMHRQIINAPPEWGIIVDHINGNKLDNRKSNLRLVTQVENQRNRPNINRNNTTGITGVWFHKKNNTWCAEIMVRRQKICLGSFGSIELAAAARREAVKIYFGEFAPCVA